MKLVVLHGQAHHGSTWNVTRMLLEQLRPDTEDLKEFTVNGLPHCAGCAVCILDDESKCPHRDRVGEIIEAIEQADVVIVESPTYCMGMTGQLKSLFDHMAYRWLPHRPHPAMADKIGVAISTAAGGGAGRVTKDIVRQFFWWGIPRSYRIGQPVFAAGWDHVSEQNRQKLAANVQAVARQIRRRSGKRQHSLRLTILFRVMAAMQRGGKMSPVDRTYWQANGWI